MCNPSAVSAFNRAARDRCRRSHRRQPASGTQGDRRDLGGVGGYTIGGYQAMKKWLSYREKALLGRDLKVEEMREVMRMARRIASILLLQPPLGANSLA